jgi:protoporphyrinogen oxidase
MFFWPFNDRYTDGLFDEIIQDDPIKSPLGSVGYNDIFYYPKNGLNTLVDNMAKGLDIRYNKKLVGVKGKTAIFQDGEEVDFDKMISTIPLSVMANIIGLNTPDLPHTSVCVLNIGATRLERCPKDHWVYVPYSESGFYRVGFYSNVDASSAPKNCVSIYVERAWKNGRQELGHYPSEVIKELQYWGWIGSVQVVDISWVDYAYTWLRPSHSREYYIQVLKDKGIISTGRYGKWRFQGIAESVKDGLAV